MAGTFRDELRGTLAEGFCTALEYIGNFADAFGGANPATIPLTISPLRAAYRLLCNREPPDPLPPTFTGGQCPINYTVNVQWNRKAVVAFQCVDSGTEFGQQFFVLGPITGLTVEYSDGAAGLYITHGAGGTQRRQVYLYSGTNDCPAQFTSYSITSVVPPPGTPDTCGDPPPIIPPPVNNYNDIDFNFDYTNNEGDNINIGGNFIFAPVRINLDGELTVPVRLDFSGGTLQLGGDLNLNNGDLNLNFGNPNYNRNGKPNPDGFKPDPSLPPMPDDIPDDVPNPPDDSTEPETTRLLRACIVTTSIVPPSVSKIIQNSNPDILAPNLGYVAFAINVNGKIAWTSDIPVKNQRNFIEVPWEGGAVEVRGTPRPGVAWTITPVYAIVEDAVVFS